MAVVGRLAALCSLLVALGAARAHAQDDASSLTVPPPPGARAAPEAAPPPPASTTAPPPSAATAPPGELAVPPPPGAPAAAPAAEVVRPLLDAAEQDMAAGRHVLALSRASVVSHALPENTPLRIRADGLRLIAQQRMGGDATPPPLDEVLAPLVAQAELDVRGRRMHIALPRLDFAMSRLAEGSPLRDRAARLREIAIGASQTPAAPTQPTYAPAPVPYVAVPPTRPPRPERDPTERTTGEAVELYITGSLLGALTGGYIPFVASDQTAGTVTYTLSVIGGAAVFAVGVLSLDLSGALRSGIPPTISSSIRFGFANGMFAFGLAAALGMDDPNGYFSLAWGGAATGALVGLAVGFGAQPSTREARIVESFGWWGAGLAGGVSLLTDYQDEAVAFAIPLAGLNAGLLGGIAAAAGGLSMSTRRVMFIDLGFFLGFGVGVGLTTAGYLLSRANHVEAPALGVGGLIGAVGGWTLLYLITDGMDDAASDVAELPFHLGASPLPGGGMVTIAGQL